MYKLINKKSPFLLLDICKDLNSGNLGYINEVKCNTGQTQDYHQWSYSMISLFENRKIFKGAWYQMDELELVSDILSKGKRR